MSRDEPLMESLPGYRASVWYDQEGVRILEKPTWSFTIEFPAGGSCTWHGHPDAGSAHAAMRVELAAYAEHERRKG